MFNAHTHDPCAQHALVNLFHNQQPAQNAWYSVGLHPWHITGNWQQQFAQVTHTAQHKAVKAIGECGPDRTIQTHWQIQLAVWKEHILLAEKLQKPLLIHCVKAYDTLGHMRKHTQARQPWLLHGFSGNFRMLQDALAHGCYASFGTRLLQDGHPLQAVFQSAPLHSVFLETDNRPIAVSAVYQKAALLKKMSVEELQLQIWRNFARCFGENQDFVNHE